MIKSISIRNFKSIKHLKIELAPLTIFVGPNASGKSSILEAVALMRQCIGGIGGINDNKTVMNSIRGELVNFEDKKHIYCKGIEDEPLSLGLATDVEIEDVRKSAIDDIQHFSTLVQDVALQKYVDFLKNGLLRSLNLQLASGERKCRITYVNTLTGDSYEHSYSINTIYVSYKKDGESKCTPPEMKLSTEYGAAFLPRFTISGYILKLFETISWILRNEIKNVYFISSVRGDIPWIYGPITETKAWVGRGGENTMEILARLMKPDYEDKRLPYELFCEMFGIKSVWAGWHMSSYLTSGYKDPFLGSSHKFPSLGHGSKQLLPIITQLAYSDPGSIMLIEEPEMSLHPSFQRLLPALFARAVNEGKQILVTTHSSYFPLSLELVLRKEGFKLEGQTTRGKKKYEIKLSVDDVAVYHVTRDKKGFTKIDKLEIDENGLKEGIPSFIEVEKEILGRFISRE